MSDCGIISVGSKYDEALDEDLLTNCKRISNYLLPVPNPRFEENPGHAQVMNGILDAQRALLIMGFQGVGKNRVVDYHSEREYLQLHRDTAVNPAILTFFTVH